MSGIPSPSRLVRLTVSAAPAPSRIPARSIDPFVHERWSSRAFTAEEISVDTLMGLFEAARWAPSANNAQPWRFVYARRGTPAFERFLATLAPANQLWAGKASALVAVVSLELMAVSGEPELVPSASHSFDAGAAWAQLALQAHLWGWSTHAMGGFDREKAGEALSIPTAHHVEVFVAIGKRGDASALPDWARRERPRTSAGRSRSSFTRGHSLADFCARAPSSTPPTPPTQGAVP
jgi:nitroreductase